jgi:DNA (cytosine-5)-methyltransferase 3A
MRVLSLFDGISGAQQALYNLGVKPRVYYASEINKHAIKVAKTNFPLTIHLGDVRDVIHNIGTTEIDLVIFGSPCTDLSIGKKNRKSLKGDASSLFYEAVKILKYIKPRYFLMENVASMSQESMDEISNILGVQPIRINSNQFIPQNRDRLYWCNWNVRAWPSLNPDKFESLLLPYADVVPLRLSEKAYDYMERQVKGGRNHWDFGLHSDTSNKNSACVVSNFKKGVPYNVVIDRRWLVEDRVNMSPINLHRHFHPIECERLQGFPDNYTDGIAKTHRYEAIGNSFTVPVIQHLLRPII